MNWKNTLLTSTEKAENFADKLLFRIRKKLKLNLPAVIMPYRSYGTRTRMYIKGRVLENKIIKASKENQSVFTTLKNMYKRFQSNEVPGVKVCASYHDKNYEVVTDEEGYFTLNFFPEDKPSSYNLWHPVKLKIMESPIPWKDQEYIAEVMVPPVDAEFGVISDIDDTIVETSATKVLGMAKTVFLNNAHSRLPFAGVAAFYKSLMLGKNGKRNNPFFYVSSSPWNMYDLLKEFLDLNKIPEGPLLLRDFGLQDNKFFSSGHHGHKTKEIINILDTFPDLKFILIGDSGQQDLYIYRDIARSYPDRILAIYIRDLALSKTAKRIENELENSMETDVEVALIKNAEEAAQHAAAKGFIFSEALPEIEKDKKQDEGVLPGKVEA